MKQGVIEKLEQLVKSYSKTRKLTRFCLFVFDDFLVIIHLWYHVIKPAERPVSGSVSRECIQRTHASHMAGPFFSHL